MALPKNTKRIAQATVGTFAGVAAFIGGRAAYKKHALPAAENESAPESEAASSNQASTESKERKMALPKISLPKVDIPKPSLPEVNLPGVNIPKINLPKPEVPKVDLPSFARRSSTRPIVRDTFTPEGDPIRVLEVGRAFQSVTYTEPAWRFECALEYYRAFDLLFDLGPEIESILALGAGGCAWPKHASYEHPDVRVDAIEADPDIVRIAHQKFFIDELPEECSFTLHQSDALDYLLKCREDNLKYNAIVNDCFDGKHADEGLLSEDSLRLSKQCMQENGLYLLNAVSARKGKSLKNVKKATKALNKVFKHVYVFPCTDTDMGGEDNYVLVATDGKYKIER